MITYSEKAKQYIGVRQGSKQHKAIIDYYNQLRPLPQGYKMKYTDSWCACFVSVILDMCKGVKIPYECSCKRMLDLCKKNKQVIASTQGGEVNNIIFYDWKNDGTVNHVGIISGVSDSAYTVIEGNKSKMVGVRTIRKDDNEIEAIARVLQETDAQKPTNDLITTLAYDVIRGKYGTGKTRKQLLGEYYSEVQTRVNEILKK